MKDRKGRGFSSNGAMLCRLLISGMIFTFPRDCVVHGAGALMTLIEMDPQTSVAWIANSVAMLPPENLSADERNKFITQIAKYDPGTLLTSSAATGEDYRRIQRQIQDFVAIYRRRVISPRSKSQGKGFFDGVTFRFRG
jgi:transportin-3